MRLMILAVVVALLALAIPAMAQEPPSVIDVGAVGIHTADGETLAGIALGFHVIPPGKDAGGFQRWASEHLTLDLLQTGSQLDAISANLGVSLNLLAPEGRLKGGITYLFDRDTPAFYFGYSVSIR